MIDAWVHIRLYTSSTSERVRIRLLERLLIVLTSCITPITTYYKHECNFCWIRFCNFIIKLLFESEREGTSRIVIIRNDIVEQWRETFSGSATHISPSRVWFMDRFAEVVFICLVASIRLYNRPHKFWPTWESFVPLYCTAPINAWFNFSGELYRTWHIINNWSAQVSVIASKCTDVLYKIRLQRVSIRFLIRLSDMFATFISGLPTPHSFAYFK